MTVEELQKLESATKLEQTKIYEKAVKLFDSGEYRLEKYQEIGAINKLDNRYRLSRSSRRILSKTLICSDTIQSNDSIESLIEMLEEFRTDYLELNAIGKTEMSLEESASDRYIECLVYIYSYLSLDRESLQKEIQRLTGEAISNRLKPKNSNYEQAPDCNLLQLFRDGSIDWTTLQKITYSNCDL